MTLSGRYSPAVIEWVLRQQGATDPFPPAADRGAWQLTAERLGEEAAELLEAADLAALEPVPQLPATLYLDFERTGRRKNYERVADERRERLRILVLAECLSFDEKLQDAILDLVWAICEESDWCRPAHQPSLADLRRPFLDLTSAMTALLLAESDHLLGDRLHPAARKRLREEIDRRCLTPYLDRHDFHWMFATPEHGVNNWAAVIAAGVVGAACYLEGDEARLAAIISRGLRSLDEYRASFDVDGGTTEGSFCWAYGFGHYTMLAHLIEHRTGGLVSLWDERGREIARFPLKTYIGPRRFVNFSDCPINFTHIPAHLAYLSRRLEIPELMRVAAQQPPNERQGQLQWALRTLFWAPDPVAEGYVAAKSDHFRGMQWMVARLDPADPDALVLAAKGGHNSEMHNQNDVGNFTVDAFGEPLLVDLGKGGFNRAYFRHTGGRYDFLVNASRGHSVPLVHGCQQAYGRQYCAKELERVHDASGDRLVLDISEAYPQGSGLTELTRSLVLNRQAGTVEVEDRVRFGEGPRNFQSALITLSPVTLADGEATVKGERGDLVIAAQPPGLLVEVEEIEGIELEGVPVTIRRVTFRPGAPVEELEIGLTITPRRRDGAEDKSDRDRPGSGRSR